MVVSQCVHLGYAAGDVRSIARRRFSSNRFRGSRDRQRSLSIPLQLQPDLVA